MKHDIICDSEPLQRNGPVISWHQQPEKSGAWMWSRTCSGSPVLLAPGGGTTYLFFFCVSSGLLAGAPWRWMVFLKSWHICGSLPRNVWFSRTCPGWCSSPLLEQKHNRAFFSRNIKHAWISAYEREPARFCYLLVLKIISSGRRTTVVLQFGVAQTILSSFYVWAIPSQLPSSL